MARTPTLATLLVVAAALGGAAWLLQGPVPPDVRVTRFLQGVLPTPFDWPGRLSALGKMPWVLATIGAGAGLAALVGGVRGALAVPLAYGLARLADLALRAVLFVPRPNPELIAAAGASASSGLPSTFGLTFGALFSVAFWVRGPPGRAEAVRLIVAFLLLLGALARILPGGHWPSQMIASLVLGAVLAGLAVRIALRRPAVEGSGRSGSRGAGRGLKR